MTLKEKLDYYASYPRCEKPRVDLRSRIRRFVLKSGVSQASVARSVGIAPQNFSLFLNGRIASLPLSVIEHLMWLMDTSETEEGER